MDHRSSEYKIPRNVSGVGLDMFSVYFCKMVREIDFRNDGKAELYEGQTELYRGEVVWWGEVVVW